MEKVFIINGKKTTGSFFKKEVEEIRKTMPFLWEDYEEVLSLPLGEEMESSGGHVKRIK